MIIPSPQLERLPFDMHGLSPLQQTIFKWFHPPLYKLTKDYIITLDDGLQLIHPEGFVIDGASIPRLLWPIISPTGPLLEGSIPHDFYYQHGYLLAIREHDIQMNKRSMQMVMRSPEIFGGHLFPVFIGRGQIFGDRLLHGITVEKHGATVDADRAYLALRCFGWRAWSKYRHKGPGAYNTNSLGFPGITTQGIA